jgi:hypothetical protein
MCCEKRACAANDFCCFGNWGKLRRRHLSTKGVELYYIGAVVFIVMTLIGLGFLVSLVQDGRSENLAAFNAAVAAWPGYAEAFAGKTVTYTNFNNPASGTLIAYPMTTPDSYPDTDGANMPTVNMHYISGATGSFPIPSQSYVDNAKTNIIVNVDNVTSLVTVTLFETTSRTSTSNGHTHTEKSYKCAQSICFVAGPTGSIIDGCALDNGANANTQMRSCDPSQTFVFVGNIDVRSYADPYAVAVRVCGGNLDFGVKQAVKGIIGGVLFGLGIFFFAALCHCVTKMQDAPYVQPTPITMPPDFFAPGPPSLPNFFATPGAQGYPVTHAHTPYSQGNQPSGPLPGGSAVVYTTHMQMYAPYANAGRPGATASAYPSGGAAGSTVPPAFDAPYDKGRTLAESEPSDPLPPLPPPVYTQTL